jgi:hypothetical protein
VRGRAKGRLFPELGGREEVFRAGAGEDHRQKPKKESEKVGTEAQVTYSRRKIEKKPPVFSGSKGTWNHWMLLVADGQQKGKKWESSLTRKMNRRFSYASLNAEGK